MALDEAPVIWRDTIMQLMEAEHAVREEAAKKQKATDLKARSKQKAREFMGKRA